MGIVASILYPLTFAVVLLFGIFLLALGVASLLAPVKAKAFLLGFATSASTHFLEMFFRLAVGGALLVQAPYMPYPRALTIFRLAADNNYRSPDLSSLEMASKIRGKSRPAGARLSPGCRTCVHRPRIRSFDISFRRLACVGSGGDLVAEEDRDQSSERQG